MILEPGQDVITSIRKVAIFVLYRELLNASVVWRTVRLRSQSTATCVGVAGVVVPRGNRVTGRYGRSESS